MAEIRLFTDTWHEYSLLDSGNKKRLERFGKYVLIRDDPRAWWQPDLPESEWEKAVGFFEEKREERGVWHFNKPIPEAWHLRFDRLQFEVRCTDMSKHVGVFPEHAAHWRWMQQKIRAAKKVAPQRTLTVLNLFGYTGVASLVCAAEGCSVTHVDASPKAIGWGRSSQAHSNLQDKPIRWIEDDVVKFVKREGRRGKRYDAIILDPPKYGRGPKGEIWKVERDLPELLDNCKAILSENPVFLLLTMYSTEDSSCTVGNLLMDLMRDRLGTISVGELVLPHQYSDKLLSVSVCGLWAGS
jgi:23S rRNA (cytosine1962-C5)-methyltransferase